MKTRLVVKLIAVLVLLLAVVLYKMNDFYRQEKLFQAETQIQKQIRSEKTSVSSQLQGLRNTLSSYEVEIKENQINWVQLNPFFAIAQVQKKSDGSFTVLQYVGRSGSMGERWNGIYLEKALAVRKSTSDKPIQARLFKDRTGAKFLAIILSSSNQRQTAVVGNADYFQKYFDLERGGPLTSSLLTSDHILVAHSESDYVATVSDEDQLSTKKYLLEKEEVAGTNLIAVAYALKSTVAPAWMVPWSVVGLIFGFGFVLIGLLFYGLDPMDKKIERYKKQERENIFKETVQSETEENHRTLAAETRAISGTSETTSFLVERTRAESVEKAQEAFAEPNSELAEATLNGPLQQSLFNLDILMRESQIKIEKDINTRLSHSMYYGAFIKSFENILRNSIEALHDRQNKKIVVRAYDIDQITVIEIQDNGAGLSSDPEAIEKIWQPFYTTKLKSKHMGLGLTEALSIFRRCGGELTIESLPSEGTLVKLIMKKEKQTYSSVSKGYLEDDLTNTSLSFADTKTHFIEAEVSAKAAIESNPDEINLDEVLSLDEVDSENLFSSQKVNLKSKIESVTATMKMPNFNLNKKEYQVDQYEVKIRRPEKS